MHDVSRVVKKLAVGSGFDLVGITPAEPLYDEGRHLMKWLDQGFHAEMRYMQRNFNIRTDPSLHLPSAKSVIMLGTNYYNNTALSSDVLSRISKYARGVDYHLVLKNRIKSLIDNIKKETNIEFNSKIFVDSSPILERALAKRAGLGRFGKNSCIINKRFGSWIFLCGIIIDLELEYDKQASGSICGRCTRCIDACPTGAIVEPYIVDSRLCISYHTIENRGEIPDSIQKRMNGRIFGCDICQEVCPWNKKAPETAIKEFLPGDNIKNIFLKEILNLSEDRFKALFSNSPIKRVGWAGFLRNVRIVLSSVTPEPAINYNQ